MRALIRSFPQTSQPWLPCLWRLEHEADPLRIGLALQAVEPASRAAEADPPGFADADAPLGLIGTTGQGLGGIGVEVVCDPGGIRLGRKGMQGVFRGGGKGISRPGEMQASEGEEVTTSIQALQA